MKELWKLGKIPKFIRGGIVVLEEGSKKRLGNMMHKPDELQQNRGTNLNLTIVPHFMCLLGL